MMQRTMVEGGRSIPTSLGMVGNILGATADLVNAVRSLPGPIWDFLLAPHNAQQHEALPERSRPNKACLPCAFQTMIDATHPGEPSGYLDPANLVPPPTVKLACVEETQPITKPDLHTVIFDGAHT